MLSYQEIAWSQVMQCEPGKAIDSCLGTRAATTFKKLPSASPGERRKPLQGRSSRGPYRLGSDRSLTWHYLCPRRSGVTIEGAPLLPLSPSNAHCRVAKGDRVLEPVDS